VRSTFAALCKRLRDEYEPLFAEKGVDFVIGLGRRDIEAEIVRLRGQMGIGRERIGTTVIVPIDRHAEAGERVARPPLEVEQDVRVQLDGALAKLPRH
jgi:hypothetical protein